MDQHAESTTGEDSDAVMGLLRDHVPLSLLVDLSQGVGLDSAEIAHVEGGNADWLDPS
jgi:hypothetical protein